MPPSSLDFRLNEISIMFLCVCVCMCVCACAHNAHSRLHIPHYMVSPFYIILSDRLHQIMLFVWGHQIRKQARFELGSVLGRDS